MPPDRTFIPLLPLNCKEILPLLADLGEETGMRADKAARPARAGRNAPHMGGGSAEAASISPLGLAGGGKRRAWASLSADIIKSGKSCLGGR